MRKRTTTRLARSLPIVASAIFVLGGCEGGAQQAGENADPAAGQEPSQAAAQETGQDQAGAGCWVRPDRPLEGRPSPFDSTEVTLDAGTIKVCYSRPQRRDRTIFGDLAPFDEPWRLGANEATAIYVSAPATIGDVDVEPGWYTIYAVPGENEWQMVVNAETQRWGVPIDDNIRARDVGSITIPVEQSDAPVEQLAMTLEPTSANEATLITEWEETRVSVPIRMR